MKVGDITDTVKYAEWVYERIISAEENKEWKPSEKLVFCQAREAIYKLIGIIKEFDAKD